MLASVHSASVLGVDAHPVLVEVDVARGLPAWSIVGLASSAVKEARERVCAALVNSGFDVPARRTTVNLSPDNCTIQSQSAEKLGCLPQGELALVIGSPSVRGVNPPSIWPPKRESTRTRVRGRRPRLHAKVREGERSG
jgi:hypothetical protein